jgi:hypothetical protein
MIRLLIILLILMSYRVHADCGDQCPPKLSEHERVWTGRVRLRALMSMDRFLSWSASDDLKTYALAFPLREETLRDGVPELKTFADKYSYFSPTWPIVAKVTSDPEDLELTCCLLKALYEKGGLQISVAEVLAKVLAYRDLKGGQRIKIPVELSGKISLESFTVDRVFNLWNGMPAFGLVSDRKGVPSLLLFRGTDFSLDSRRSFASIMSDLELAGPGLHAFHKAQKELDLWLKKVQRQGKASRVLGFSLGGALAAYTFIYENEWLAESGSVAFCAPGVAQAVIEDWQLLSKEKQQGFISYVNTGDIIPKVGKLFGAAYCLTAPRTFKPLTSHTMLMTSEPTFTKALIDVAKENASR